MGSDGLFASKADRRLFLSLAGAALGGLLLGTGAVLLMGRHPCVPLGLLALAGWVSAMLGILGLIAALVMRMRIRRTLRRLGIRSLRDLDKHRHHSGT